MVGDQVGKDKIEHIRFTTPEIKREQIEKIKELFPEAVGEDKVNFETLKQTLGEVLDDRKERYFFTWAGKQQSIKILQRPGEMTLKPDRAASIDFDSTKNVFIEGENLEVLKLLYKAYFGRVKMIYIDPPYNTGKEFIYPDDYSHPLETYLKLTGQKDESGNSLTSNPETSGRYHSAWLSMMYPRLFIARQLLRDDGVIFVSIDDHEVHNLRMIMNEIFGEENFIATVIWQKNFAPKNTAQYFSEDHDYVVVYCKNADLWRPLNLPRTEDADARYSNPDNDPRGPWASSDLTARNYYSQGQYEVTGPTGNNFKPTIGSYWRFTFEKFLQLDKDGRIWWGKNGDNMPRLKRFLSEVKQGIVPQTLWTYDKVGHTQDAKKELLEFVKFENTENVLNTVKPIELIKRMLRIASEAESSNIIVDFFAGSAPTAHSILALNHEDYGNRRFVCVQLPEPLPKPETRLKTIADIGKERIGNVIASLKSSENGQTELKTRVHLDDLGFRLFKLAPSNFRVWQQLPPDSTADAYTKQLELFSDPLLEGFDPEDVIYEIALKEGFAPTSRIENVPAVNDAIVYIVTDDDKGQKFYICLDDQLQLESLRSLNFTKDDLFICRGSAIDDTTAANLAVQCRLKLI
jgi:adenine-specific DNA-methyltransferase